MSAPKKVVLAYSGGLDTSIILKWLQTEYGCEVVTFTADLGQGEELEPARKKAEMLGIAPENIFIEDVREEFVRDFVFPMFRANALYEGLYLLGTSIARPLISKRLVEIAAAVVVMKTVFVVVDFPPFPMDRACDQRPPCRFIVLSFGIQNRLSAGVICLGEFARRGGSVAHEVNEGPFNRRVPHEVHSDTCIHTTESALSGIAGCLPFRADVPHMVFDHRLYSVVAIASIEVFAFVDKSVIPG